MHGADGMPLSIKNEMRADGAGQLPWACESA
jgi:hypothetical protein